MKKYRLGNMLRGGFVGEFSSQEEAWLKLGSAFLLQFPCETFDPKLGIIRNKHGCRHVHLFVYEENQYGIIEWVRCKSDYFYMKDCLPVTIDQYSYEYHNNLEFF